MASQRNQPTRIPSEYHHSKREAGALAQSPVIRSTFAGAERSAGCPQVDQIESRAPNRTIARRAQTISNLSPGSGNSPGRDQAVKRPQWQGGIAQKSRREIRI